MATVNSIISRGNNKFRRLIQKDIREKNLIKTGDLIQSIDPVFSMEKGELNIEVGAIHYYKFLDDGTKFITARNITSDVVESSEFTKLIEDIIFQLTEKKVDELLINLGKNNKNITVKL